MHSAGCGSCSDSAGLASTSPALCPPPGEGFSSVPTTFPNGSLTPSQRTAGAPLIPRSPELCPEVSLLMGHLEKLPLRFPFPDTFLFPWSENSSLRLVVLFFNSQLFPAVSDFNANALFFLPGVFGITFSHLGEISTMQYYCHPSKALRPNKRKCGVWFFFPD